MKFGYDADVYRFYFPRDLPSYLRPEGSRGGAGVEAEATQAQGSEGRDRTKRASGPGYSSQVQDRRAGEQHLYANAGARMGRRQSIPAHHYQHEHEPSSAVVSRGGESSHAKVEAGGMRASLSRTKVQELSSSGVASSLDHSDIREPDPNSPQGRMRARRASLNVGAAAGALGSSGGGGGYRGSGSLSPGNVSMRSRSRSPPGAASRPVSAHSMGRGSRPVSRERTQPASLRRSDTVEDAEPRPAPPRFHRPPSTEGARNVDVFAYPCASGVQLERSPPPAAEGRSRSQSHAEEDNEEQQPSRGGRPPSGSRRSTSRSSGEVQSRATPSAAAAGGDLGADLSEIVEGEDGEGSMKEEEVGLDSRGRPSHASAEQPASRHGDGNQEQGEEGADGALAGGPSQASTGSVPIRERAGSRGRARDRRVPFSAASSSSSGHAKAGRGGLAWTPGQHEEVPEGVSGSEEQGGESVGRGSHSQDRLMAARLARRGAQGGSDASSGQEGSQGSAAGAGAGGAGETSLNGPININLGEDGHGNRSTVAIESGQVRKGGAGGGLLSITAIGPVTVHHHNNSRAADGPSEHASAGVKAMPMHKGAADPRFRTADLLDPAASHAVQAPSGLPSAVHLVPPFAVQRGGVGPHGGSAPLGDRSALLDAAATAAAASERAQGLLSMASAEPMSPSTAALLGAAASKSGRPAALALLSEVVSPPRTVLQERSINIAPSSSVNSSRLMFDTVAEEGDAVRAHAAQILKASQDLKQTLSGGLDEIRRVAEEAARQAAVQTVGMVRTQVTHVTMPAPAPAPAPAPMPASPSHAVARQQAIAATTAAARRMGAAIGGQSILDAMMGPEGAAMRSAQLWRDLEAEQAGVHVGTHGGMPHHAPPAPVLLDGALGAEAYPGSGYTGSRRMRVQGSPGGLGSSLDRQRPVMSPGRSLSPGGSRAVGVAPPIVYELLEQRTQERDAAQYEREVAQAERDAARRSAALSIASLTGLHRKAQLRDAWGRWVQHTREEREADKTYVRVDPDTGAVILSPSRRQSAAVRVNPGSTAHVGLLPSPTRGRGPGRAAAAQDIVVQPGRGDTINIRADTATAPVALSMGDGVTTMFNSGADASITVNGGRATVHGGGPPPPPTGGTAFAQISADVQERLGSSFHMSSDGPTPFSLTMQTMRTETSDAAVATEPRGSQARCLSPPRRVWEPDSGPHATTANQRNRMNATAAAGGRSRSVSPSSVGGGSRAGSRPLSATAAGTSLKPSVRVLGSSGMNRTETMRSEPIANAGPNPGITISSGAGGSISIQAPPPSSHTSAYADPGRSGYINPARGVVSAMLDTIGRRPSASVTLAQPVVTISPSPAPTQTVRFQTGNTRVQVTSPGRQQASVAIHNAQSAHVDGSTVTIGPNGSVSVGGTGGYTAGPGGRTVYQQGNGTTVSVNGSKVTVTDAAGVGMGAHTASMSGSTVPGTVSISQGPRGGVSVLMGQGGSQPAASHSYTQQVQVGNTMFTVTQPQAGSTASSVGLLYAPSAHPQYSQQSGASGSTHHVGVHALPMSARSSPAETMLAGEAMQPDARALALQSILATREEQLRRMAGAADETIVRLATAAAAALHGSASLPAYTIHTTQATPMEQGAQANEGEETDDREEVASLMSRKSGRSVRSAPGKPLRPSAEVPPPRPNQPRGLAAGSRRSQSPSSGRQRGGTGPDAMTGARIREQSMQRSGSVLVGSSFVSASPKRQGNGTAWWFDGVQNGSPSAAGAGSKYQAFDEKGYRRSPTRNKGVGTGHSASGDPTALRYAPGQTRRNTGVGTEESELAYAEHLDSADRLQAGIDSARAAGMLVVRGGGGGLPGPHEGGPHAPGGGVPLDPQDPLAQFKLPGGVLAHAGIDGYPLQPASPLARFGGPGSGDQGLLPLDGFRGGASWAAPHAISAPALMASEQLPPPPPGTRVAAAHTLVRGPQPPTWDIHGFERDTRLSTLLADQPEDVDGRIALELAQSRGYPGPVPVPMAPAAGGPGIVQPISSTTTMRTLSHPGSVQPAHVLPPFSPSQFPSPPRTMYPTAIPSPMRPLGGPAAASGYGVGAARALRAPAGHPGASGSAFLPSSPSGHGTRPPQVTGLPLRPTMLAADLQRHPSPYGMPLQ